MKIQNIGAACGALSIISIFIGMLLFQNSGESQPALVYLAIALAVIALVMAILAMIKKQPITSFGWVSLITGILSLGFIAYTTVI